MLRWLFDTEEQPGSEICTCRGEMEVVESCLLMSVTAISRIVGPNCCHEAQDEREDGTLRRVARADHWQSAGY